MIAFHLQLSASEAHQGTKWDLTGPVRVGRVQGAEVEIDHPSISRRHAEIAPSEQSWVVRDTGSTNGTYLNGLRIGRVDQQLRDGDYLTFGSVTLLVSIAEPAPGGKTSRVQLPRVPFQAAWMAGEADPAAPPAEDDIVTPLRARADTSLDRVCTAILQEAIDTLDGQAGFLALQDAGTGRLQVRTRSGNRAPTDGLATAEQVYRTGQSALAPDRRAVYAPVRTTDLKLGVLQVSRLAAVPPFRDRDLIIADAMAARAGTDLQSMRSSVGTQQGLILSAVIALAQAVELRDEYTGGHTQRVTDYALLLADELGVSATERYHLQVGTPLHDIGKIGIADALLRKPSRLTADEYEVVKNHTLRGAAIVETIPDLVPILPIVRNHHERYDGKGYPDRLRGEQIPWLARIVAVADTFDALTSDRPYRPALPPDTAFAEVLAGAGTQFDPRCVAAFGRLRSQLEVMLLESAQVVQTARPSDVLRIRQELAGV